MTIIYLNFVSLMNNIFLSLVILFFFQSKKLKI